MRPDEIPQVIRQEYEGEGIWGLYELAESGYLGEAPGIVPRTMTPYCQRDKPWAPVRLGGSRFTVGSSGCAMVSVTMVGTLVRDIDPLEMVQYLNAHGGFTAPVPGDPNSGGLLYWSIAGQAVDGLEFVGYRKWRNTAADVGAITAALDYNPQIVQVDFHPGGALNTHFVVALALTPDGEDIEIIDPWTGQRGTLLGLYGASGWDLGRAIYALAEYRVA